jgi:hypothetical protein
MPTRASILMMLLVYAATVAAAMIRAIGITLAAAIAFDAGLPAQDPGHEHEAFYVTRQQEAEVRLWVEMIARSVGHLPSAKPGAEPPAPHVCATALTAAIAALPAIEVKTPRERAAANLRLILADGEGEPVTGAWLAEPLHDPLTCELAASRGLRQGKRPLRHHGSSHVADGDLLPLRLPRFLPRQVRHRSARSRSAA